METFLRVKTVLQKVSVRQFARPWRHAPSTSVELQIDWIHFLLPSKDDAETNSAVYMHAFLYSGVHTHTYYYYYKYDFCSSSRIAPAAIVLVI